MAVRGLEAALSLRMWPVCGLVLIDLVLLVGIIASTASTAAAINCSSSLHVSSTGLTQLNIQVSHDRYAAHAEPYLAVNPRNPRNLLGAAQIFRHPTSLPRAGIFASFDGGGTWPRQGPLPTPSNLPVAQDTTVAFDARGVGFVAAMTTPIDNGRPGDVSSITIWRTDTGGRSVRRPVVLARGRLLDHPWLTADPDGKTLYLVWDDLVRKTILFTRSTDGGSSFTPARTIYQGDMIGDPVVAAGPRGAVLVAFYHSPDGRLFSIGAVSSTNHGRSFGALRPIPQTREDHLLYVGRADPSSRLGAAIDPQTGMLFVVYAAYRGASASQSDVLLSRSPDGGQTWLSPTRVNHATAGAQTINQQPQVTVSRGGEVDVLYLAQRGFRMNVYLGESVSHGSAFQRSIRVTSRSFDPSLGIRTLRPGSWWIGDYQGLATGPRTIYPFWNDTRRGHLEIFTAVVLQIVDRHGHASATRKRRPRFSPSVCVWDFR